MKPLPLVGNTLFIDASTLERYTKCPRQWELYALEKREASAVSPGRDFGKLMHTLWEEHYKRDVLGHVPRPYSELIDDFYRTVVFPPEDHRTPDLAAHIIDAYEQEYLVEPFDLVPTASPMIEQSFAIPLGSIETRSGVLTIAWCGKIDLVTRWTVDNSVWVADHKTSSIGGDTFWADFQNSLAQIGYCWAVQHLLSVPVTGYVINAAFIRKPTKTGRSLEFARNKYWLDPERVAEWRGNVMRIAENLVSDHERGYCAMHTWACVHRFGRCEYLPTCELPRSSRDAMLASNVYKEVTWTPLK